MYHPELGRRPCILLAESFELAGQGILQQGMSKAVAQTLVSGFPRYHAFRFHKVGSRDWQGAQGRAFAGGL